MINMIRALFGEQDIEVMYTVFTDERGRKHTANGCRAVQVGDVLYLPRMRMVRVLDAEVVDVSGMGTMMVRVRRITRGDFG